MGRLDRRRKADLNVLGRLITQPARIPRAILRAWPGASFESRLEWDALDYPYYAYGLQQAAREARALGLPSISAVELGVGGGRGLIAMESHATAISRQLGVGIDVYGFDTGAAQPKPRDYRDLPYVWKAGYFAMDVELLRSRLHRTELILGDVMETIPAFLARPQVSPVGFVAFDLDYYWSTASAMSLLAAPAEALLPRVFCYFDDIVGDDAELHSEHAGALLGIEEFNAANSDRKLGRIHGLEYKRWVRAEWHLKQYVMHDFSHPLYDRHIGPSDWHLPLDRPTSLLPRS